MTRTRTIVLAGAVLVAAALAATVALVSGGGASSGPAPISNGRVSLLERPRTATDDLPADVAGLPVASRLSSAAAARLATVDGSLRVYVAPAREGDVCLIVADAEERSTLVNCAPKSLLRTTSIYIARPASEEGATDVIGVVGDGVVATTAHSARGATVASNVFVMRGLRGRELTLDGAAGAEGLLDIGPQQPPP